MFAFHHRPEYRYYGGGSKTLGLELSQKQTKFWNTDAFADFNGGEVHEGRPDPYYISIPYLIIKTPHGWVGLLYNNPYAAFFSTGCQMDIEGFADVDSEASELILMGSEEGQPDLFIIAAESIAELTRKLQKLTGVTPLPPLWALGYHQCRWGYQSTQQLRDLRATFAEHKIPVDGLWLDIGFMDEKKVFTTRDELIPDPNKEFSELLESGHPVVPIIDPGVKKLAGYPIYDDGIKRDVFCKNPEGNDFVGLVWPGSTVFPDFSRAEVRTWWAEKCSDFASLGLIGAWLDMNDPSVGPVNPYDMRFGKGGEKPHEYYHNQYALGMAQATRQGFESAHPDQRIFLLTRSSFLSGQRYAAVWTGDNISNYHYLKNGMTTTLNLALSGMPFNGGDIGGFGDDTTPELLQDWIKAACLMPFCRNHCVISAIEQEPWKFDQQTLEINRNFIRLRYKLMPYLYNLFVEHEVSGEAIWRPLFYSFPNCKEPELDYVDDAFMVGPSILQAPFLSPEETRNIPLPGNTRWFDVHEEKWLDGGQTLQKVKRRAESSPLFIRSNAILPLRRELPTNNTTNLREIDLLLTIETKEKASASYLYVADDGQTKKYQNGERSRLNVEVSTNETGVHIQTNQTEDGFGEINYRILMLTKETTTLNGSTLALHPEKIQLGAQKISVYASQPVTNF